jgi:hypothetical protein
VRGYKFLANDGRGVFSHFAWPLPNGEPGAWVESEVEPCRSGVHACRIIDLPYWIAPALYEIELDGPVDRQAIKIVAPRGRLIRRIDDWNEETRVAYAQMCRARARELAAEGPERVAAWAPSPERTAAGPAMMGFVAARIAEELGGLDAYMEERMRQSAWLADRLGLD